MNTDMNNFDLIVQYLMMTSTNVCLSGGAIGADRRWGELARMYNHEVIHFSFSGHNYSGHDINHRIIVPPLALTQADSKLKVASKSLGKKANLSHSSYVSNLLRRNYWQICHSNSVYAVTTFNKHSGIPEGGTSWAVQMFIDKHKQQTPYDECKCYILDKITNTWHQYICNNTWELIDIPPAPQGIWTGIGSRDISSNTEIAMNNIFT